MRLERNGKEAPVLDILAITTPIFLIIGLGYLARAGGLIDKAPLQGIGTFVRYFALPALVIRALTQNPLGEVFNPYYLLAYGTGSLAVFALGRALILGLERKSLSSGAVQALGMPASNSGLIGYPVAAMALGPLRRSSWPSDGQHPGLVRDDQPGAGADPSRWSARHSLSATSRPQDSAITASRAAR